MDEKELRNMTAKKLIKWIELVEGHIKEYEKILDKETKELNIVFNEMSPDEYYLFLIQTGYIENRVTKYKNSRRNKSITIVEDIPDEDDGMYFEPKHLKNEQPCSEFY